MTMRSAVYAVSRLEQNHHLPSLPDSQPTHHFRHWMKQPPTCSTATSKPLQIRLSPNSSGNLGLCMTRRMTAHEIPAGKQVYLQLGSPVHRDDQHTTPSTAQERPIAEDSAAAHLESTPDVCANALCHRITSPTARSKEGVHKLLLFGRLCPEHGFREYTNIRKRSRLRHEMRFCSTLDKGGS
jgi:hypothetical protein